MSTPITGDSSTFYPVIPCPSDSDLRNSTTLNAALQYIIDNTAYLYAHAIDGITAGEYAPYGGIVIVGTHGGYIGVKDGAVLSIGPGGASVHSDDTSTWSDYYHFVGATITLDATSSLTSSTTITINSTGSLSSTGIGINVYGEWTFDPGAVLVLPCETDIEYGGILILYEGSIAWFRGFVELFDVSVWEGTWTWGTVTPDSLVVNIAYGTRIELNGLINCYRSINILGGAAINIGVGNEIANAGVINNFGSGGHLLRKCVKLVNPASGPVTPYATSDAIPEILQLTLTSNSTTIVIPVGEGGQTLRVTTEGDSGAYKATINLSRFGGGLSISQDIQNASGKIPWADYWFDGLDWIVSAQGKF
jgi:hypothetical protein